MAKQEVEEVDNRFRLTTGTPGRDEELMRGNVNIAERQTKPDKSGVYDLTQEQVDAVNKNPGLHLRAVDYEPPENVKKENAPVKTSVLDKTASETVKKIKEQIAGEITPAIEELIARVDASDEAIKGVAALLQTIEDLEKRIKKLEK